MKSFSVASGKGGVGKTSFVINLALALSQLNQKVLIFDADLGLANVDIMLGLSPKFDIRYVLNGSLFLKDIIYPTEYHFSVIPAGAGVYEITQLNPSQKLLLKAQMEEAFYPFDYLFFDISAGISDNVLFFSQLAEERLVLVTPEPTSMADAYAYIKVVNQKCRVKNFQMVVNMARDEGEGKKIFYQLLYVVEKFLPEVKLSLLGILPYEEVVKNSIRAQTPYLKLYPEAKISSKIKDIALRLLNQRTLKKEVEFKEFLDRFTNI